MKTIAIIPARGGSKRIPQKNLCRLWDKPLLAYTIEAALVSHHVERTIVSTDDPEISRMSGALGAEVVSRPPEISGDEASSEEALLHVLNCLRSRQKFEPDRVVFLQCTSPLRDPGDIDGAIETLERTEADAVFSACRNDKFIWRLEPDGPRAMNYDYRWRVREQDFPLEYRENGSIYVFKTELLRREHNRLGGKIAIYEMDYWNSFQVDTPEDIQLMEFILSMKKERVGS